MKPLFFILALLLLPYGNARAAGSNIGTKRVLVVPVDFPDLTDSRPMSYFAGVAAQVRQKYQESSYGKVDLAVTISPRIYRLPQKAGWYATQDVSVTEQAAVAAAAKSDYGSLTYTGANTAFDKIILTWPSLHNYAGSKVLATGQAHDPFVFLNGTCNLHFFAHELGHTFGNGHANALLASGKQQERGDWFDLMGGSIQNPTAQDFNPYLKWKMGWIADAQIQTITGSGTYRVNRFDDKSATGVLALKVGNLYICYRRAFPAGDAISKGAYLIRPDATRDTTTVLQDMVPGTSTPLDAPLLVGKNYKDTATGATITPTAQGGTAPLEWLDVKVTMSGSAPPSPTATPSATPTTSITPAVSPSPTATPTSTPGTPAPTPPMPTVSPTSSPGAVTASWDASSFCVYYGPDGINWPNKVEAGNAASVRIIGLTPGQQYYFSATARNSAGQESPKSSPIPYTAP